MALHPGDVGRGLVDPHRASLRTTHPGGADQLLAALGRDPAAPGSVTIDGYDGAALCATFSFNPYPGAAYGVNSAGGDSGL